MLERAFSTRRSLVLYGKVFFNFISLLLILFLSGTICQDVQAKRLVTANLAISFLSLESEVNFALSQDKRQVVIAFKV